MIRAPAERSLGQPRECVAESPKDRCSRAKLHCAPADPPDASEHPKVFRRPLGFRLVSGSPEAPTLARTRLRLLGSSGCWQ
eukprot:8799153-Alexandrium_andersonii.AAC.1